MNIREYKKTIEHYDSLKPQDNVKDVISIILNALTEASTILFKDGQYVKPTIWNFKLISLGRIALTMFLALIKSKK